MGKGRLKYGKPDANQSEIVRDLKALGFVSVVDLKSVGGGCPDLLVGISKRNYLVEIKDGSKPPSARKFTSDQEAFQASWKGAWHVILSAKDAVDWAISMRSLGTERVPVVGVVLPDGRVVT